MPNEPTDLIDDTDPWADWQDDGSPIAMTLQQLLANLVVYLLLLLAVLLAGVVERWERKEWEVGV